MKHCIFSVALIQQNEKGISHARYIKDMLEEKWELEHDCILQSYHSKFEERNEEHNISIWLDNEDTHQLIDDCMEYAREKRELDLLNMQ